GVNGRSLFLGKGDGTFQTAFEESFHHAEGGFFSVAAGDLNSDGLPDFVEIEDNGIFQFASVWLNVSCFAPSQLRISREDGLLKLSWPAPALNYLLESSPSLEPASWSPVSMPTLNTNHGWEVALPIKDTQNYF